MSSFLPLNANEEVRALTCKPVIFDSAVINSSLTPSLKYSSVLSALMFTNGRTAIVLLVVGAGVIGEARLIQKRLKARRPAAITATAAMNVANFRRLQVGNAAATSGGTSSVRFKPSGVAS